LTHDDGIVRRLAEEIADSATLENREALRAALRNAGCDNPPILEAFQSDADLVQTGWVTEALRDREFGSVVRRLVTTDV